MRILKTIIACVCIFFGGLWALQGANVLPGSFMSGQTQWLVIGIVLLIAGLGLLYHTHRAPVNRL